MSGVLNIAIVGDIIPADSPLMSGQGVFSACNGDFRPIFSALKQFAADRDFLVANFEAVLVDKIVAVSPGTSAMKAPRSVIDALLECKIRYAGIANNHTMEYGPAAFKWMCDELERSGIQTFGHRSNPLLIVEVPNQELRVGLFAFSTVPAMYGFQPEYLYVDVEKPGDNAALLDRIERAKEQCDQLLVFPHWGNEFMKTPAPWQIDLAGDMVKCGADAILGAHPHVVQSACWMDGTPVFFSLGNLLSDYSQESYKRNAVVSLSLTKQGLDVSADIFDCTHQFVIRDTREKLRLQDSIESTVSPADYAREANRLRKSVRNELIVHLLKHPLRWMWNGDLWRWLLARFFFLLANARKIKRNPNAVYSGPIH